MFVERATEYFNKMDNFIEQQDKDGLFYFVDECIDEFIMLLYSAFNNEMTENRIDTIKNNILKYALDYKELPLGEFGADICTLIGLFAIAEYEEQTGGIQDE